MSKNNFSKRLVRSIDNRKVYGVCGGIGEYFGVDPVLIRLLWILVTAFSGFFPGIIVYLLAVWVIPDSV